MTRPLHRRELLACSAVSTLAVLAPAAPRFLLASALAAETVRDPDRRLVVVQLSGGNDGLNTVVPRRDEAYRRARPTLAQPADGLLTLDDELSLHASLRGFASLWEARALTIVQGVGYPNPNRSHFESFDIWHTARTAPNSRSTGWLGRWSDATSARSTLDPSAVHVGGEVQPLALTARETAAGSLRSLDDLRLRDLTSGDPRPELLRRLEAAPPAVDDFQKFLRTTSVAALGASRRIEQAAETAETQARFPPGELARRLKVVSQLIAAGLSTRVYYVVHDGYDTHSQQAAAHASLLTELGDSLQAFHTDLVARGQADRTTVLVFSEFGRRVRENASQGTDHGAAAPLFLIGGGVRPGVIGRHPSLTDLDDGDLKHQVDFRRIYAELLDRCLGCDPSRVLDERYEPLGLWG